MLGGLGSRCGWGHDDLNLKRNQFGRKLGQLLKLPIGISVFNRKVATFDVTKFTHSLEEGLSQVGESGRAVSQKT